MTSWPSAASAWDSGRPRKPVPPAMMTLMSSDITPNENGVFLEDRVHDAGLDDELIGAHFSSFSADGAAHDDVRPSHDVAEVQVQPNLVVQVVPRADLRLQHNRIRRLGAYRLSALPDTICLNRCGRQS